MTQISVVGCVLEGFQGRGGDDAAAGCGSARVGCAQRRFLGGEPGIVTVVVIVERGETTVCLRDVSLKVDFSSSF